MELRAVADAHGTKGVSVVTTAEREKAGPLGFTILLKELGGNFEGRFDGGGAVIGIKNAGQRFAGSGSRGAGKVEEATGEINGGRVGKAEERGMSDAAELIHECAVDDGVAVAVEVGPDGGISVQIALAADIGQPGTLAGHDNDGFKVRVKPRGMGGERVPKGSPVGVNGRGDRVKSHR